MSNTTIKSEPFVTLSSRVAWSCPWYSVRQDQILLPGGEQGEYNVIQLEGAVWVVPITPSKELLLLNHYRYTVRDWCWEVPAGGIRNGQKAFDVARAELREETGGEAETWEYVGQFYTSNGISNEVAHVFLALEVRLYETAHEPAEVIEIHPTPIFEALRMAHENEISDGPSALAILLCESKLRQLIENDVPEGKDGS